MRHFEVVVIGTGPAGQKAAVQAAKHGKRVAIVEKRVEIGGACLHTGTIPSKALREAVLELTGRRARANPDSMNRKVTIDDLIYWSSRVIRTEMDVIRHQMQRNGIELITGEAVFEGTPHVVTINRPHSSEQLRADYFIIATGTRPARSTSFPFNDVDVVDSDGILNLKSLPKSMIIVGGGVIGTEYACILATLGVRVTLVEARPELLEFADREIIEALQYHMRQVGITLRLGERVDQVEIIDPPPGTHGITHQIVHATLESGKQLKADTLMYCIGRQGATASLGLESIGLQPDDRGRITVNENFQSEVPYIYAVGDVIGFPALASTSMEQGRLAASHLCGEPSKSIPALFPYGIYSIPEISMVGRNEAELTRNNVPYESGIARYRELARGQLLGDDIGMLKLLVHNETRELLGVHSIGTGATELIHIGQAVMALNGTVDFFINNVFNYPTLAEAYKVAALNAANKLAFAG